MIRPDAAQKAHPYSMPPASWPGGAQAASIGQVVGDCGPHTPGVSCVGLGGALQHWMTPLPVGPVQTWLTWLQYR